MKKRRRLILLLGFLFTIILTICCVYRPVWLIISNNATVTYNACTGSKIEMEAADVVSVLKLIHSRVFYSKIIAYGKLGKYNWDYDENGYFEITTSLGIRFKVFTWNEWGYHVLKCSILNTYYVLDTEEAQLLSKIVKKYQGQ